MSQTVTLDEQLLTDRLVDTGIISKLSRVETIDSTNTSLAEASHAPHFATQWPHMSVLTAEEQSSGRGRLHRGWASPKGTALSTSILLRPTLPRDQWHWLTLTAGLALVNTLRQMQIPAALKWPNDVHISGRKIAGLLAAVPPGDPSALIVGCGINVLLHPDQLPTSTATSVLRELTATGAFPLEPGSREAGQLRTQLLSDWLETFAALIRTFQGDDGGEVDVAARGRHIRERIIAAISTTGQRVRVELPSGYAVRGKALGVAKDGALEVEVTSRRSTQVDPDASGGPEALWQPSPPVCERFHAGDVIHLRPI